MRSPILQAAVLVLVLLAGPLLAPQDPLQQDRSLGAQPPSAAHWLGTDDFGRDQFSRFLSGASSSLAGGLAATTLTLVLAFVTGSLAGYYGNWTDRALMALADLFLTLPWLYLLIGLRAILPPALDQRAASALTLLVIALFSWARPARLVRGVVLSTSQRGFVEAARTFGVPRLRIFLRHILPSTYPVLTAQCLVLLPRFVLADVALSFFGLGIAEPHPSWGAFLLDLKHSYFLPLQWWRILPPLLMLPVFLSFARAARTAVRR